MRLFRWLGRILRAGMKSASLLVFVALLSLNAAVLTIDTVNRFFSTLIEAVAEGTSLRDTNQRAQARLQSDLDAQKARTQELQAEADRSAQRARQIEADLEAERTRAANAEADANRSALRARQLENDLEAEKKRLATVQADAQNNAERARHLERENTRLRRDALDGRSKASSGAVIQKADDLTARIVSRSTARITRSTAAVVAEAIPMVGVAVLVASLAWDTKDACETIQDMDELRASLELPASDAGTVQQMCAQAYAMTANHAQDPLSACMESFKQTGRVSEACRDNAVIEFPVPPTEQTSDPFAVPEIMID